MFSRDMKWWSSVICNIWIYEFKLRISFSVHLISHFRHLTLILILTVKRSVIPRSDVCPKLCRISLHGQVDIQMYSWEYRAGMIFNSNFIQVLWMSCSPKVYQHGIQNGWKFSSKLAFVLWKSSWLEVQNDIDRGITNLVLTRYSTRNLCVCLRISSLLEVQHDFQLEIPWGTMSMVLTLLSAW